MNIMSKILLGFIVVIMFNFIIVTIAYVGLKNLDENYNNIIDQLLEDNMSATTETDTLNQINKAKDSARSTSVLLTVFAFFAFMISYVVAMAIVPSITKPFVHLIKDMEELSTGGDNEARIDANKFTGEYKVLAETINKTVNNLQK